MPTRLKICGITNLEDARFAAGAMVDYLGFIFYPGSPRYMEPREAAVIMGWIEGVEKVGVFVDQKPDEINRIIEQTGLDLVQLHGNEQPSHALEITRPVIKSFRIHENDSKAKILKQLVPWEGTADFLLFDTYDKKQHGGTGKSWNWSLLSDLPVKTPFFIAGGISVSNAETVVKRLRPFAIDVSSSIESEPGNKDFDKMQDFFDHWNNLREMEP